MIDSIFNGSESKILIVDDQQQNVDLLEAMLTQAGYTNMTSTTDPTEVEGLCEETRFDLILLDIRMPVLSGLDILDRLSDRIKGDYLPVLVLTALTDLETRISALDKGAKDFITKPFNMIEVLNRIANMLEIRMLFNEHQRQNRLLETRVLERTAELEERNIKLNKARLEIIQRLGRASEYRDYETGNHVIRMSKNCELLAQAAGLDENLVRNIYLASPLHDVGKIGIPDNVLLKPGKFNDQEWDVMKSHVEIGADIIGDPTNELMKTAHTIVLNHHEKWDGSGYPAGRKGDEIPIEGRIAAISDVYDALTSERPYKTSWSDSEAANFIKDNSGSHFDPKLSDLFIEIIPSIIEIRKLCNDTELTS